MTYTLVRFDYSCKNAPFARLAFTFATLKLPAGI